MTRFEIGKTYEHGGLYGGTITRKVVARTEDTVTFDDSPEAQKIVVQDVPVYDDDYNVIGTSKIESAVAWTYQSPYAKDGQVDVGYVYAR